MIQKDILPSLLEALELDHPDILDSTLLALARITPRDDADLVLDEIVAQLASDHTSVQQAASLAPGVLGSPRADRTCYNLMVDNREGRKLVGGARVPRLMRAFAALAGAIYAREHLELQGSVIGKIREKFAETRDPSAKGAMAIGLGLLNAGRHGGMLYWELMETRNNVLKGHLAVGLGLMRYTRATEELRYVVETTFVPKLRQQVAIALGLMGDTDGMDALIEVLHNATMLGVSSSAAMALGLIGDRRAIPSLVAIVEDSQANKISRAFAVVALGIVGEKTDLPWSTSIVQNSNYRAKVDALAEVYDIL